VLNQAVVPISALLVPEEDKVRRHRVLRVGFLKLLGQGRGLTGSSLGEQHVVEVRRLRGLRWRGRLGEARRRAGTDGHRD
jgi:hypothetical protein